LIVLFLLGVITTHRPGERAGDHGNITPGTTANQAADPQATQATEDSTDATVVIGLHLCQRNLLDCA
jgi:inosine-uridine nucleoside N-ribohydrolase